MQTVYEKKVIGGLMKGLVLPSAVSLYPTDFEDKDLGQCLALARDLETTGRSIDPDVLTLRLYETDSGFLSVDDLRVMAASIDSASVVYEAIDRIKASSLRTRLLAETATLALQDKSTGSELLRDLKLIIDGAERYQTSENSFVYLADLAAKQSALIDDLHAGISYAVPSGFGGYDDLLGDGFSRGDEHIVVGFTGAGKSAFALNCALNQAEAGRVVGIVSREMSDTENYTRLLANLKNVPRYSIRKGMSDFAKRDLKDGIVQTSKLRIAFDTSTTTVEDLRSKVRQMVDRDGMEILYVDYLQLMTSNAKGDNRTGEVQAISRTLKLVAMENKIPVVSLCQFNRGAMNATLFDILAHLKESSSIEQDASTISYVQIERTEEAKQVKEAKVTILKNRNGATFQSAMFDYHGPVFRFIER
jgi:replicative DNA helicase